MNAHSSTSGFTQNQLKSLCKTAIVAAQNAGVWLENVDRNTLKARFKNTGSSQASQIVTEVDFRSETMIRQHLQTNNLAVDIAFVGEESSFLASENSHQAFESPYFWCVDPLDGTQAYTQGYPGYAVSIALLEQSGKPIIGVVYDPAKGRLYHAIAGQGCYLNHVPLKQPLIQQAAHLTGKFSEKESLILYADDSFNTHPYVSSLTKSLEQCADKFGLNGLTRVFGNGAVKNACHVITSSYSCYVKLPKPEEGGGSIWDFAATACIAAEAGAWVSNAKGEPLSLNSQGSTFMNQQGILYASNHQLAHSILAEF